MPSLFLPNKGGRDGETGKKHFGQLRTILCAGQSTSGEIKFALYVAAKVIEKENCSQMSIILSMTTKARTETETDPETEKNEKM